MQQTLIDQGFSLLLYGMGTVFVFLTLLVFVTGAMSKLVNRFVPEGSTLNTVDDQANVSANKSPTAIEPNIRKAIETAIKLHRNK